MQHRMRLAVMAMAALLVACGDGGGPGTIAVRVAGDSLNDSGAFGFKFTVQDGLNGSRIWVDHVAEAAGVDLPCSRHAALNQFNLIETPAAADCTSYAVGKGRINVWNADPDLVGGDAGPFSIAHQLDRMSQASAFGSGELLLVDGGGNDVADLLRTYLMAGTDGGAALGSLLAELPPPSPMPPAPFVQNAGALYMTALADKLAGHLEDFAFDRGARRVVLLNIPALTQTPYLKAIKTVLEPKLGATEAAGVLQMVDLWVQAFNSRLQVRLGADRRVVLVDLYAPFADWVANPAAHGFSDSSRVACPSEPGKADGFGLPTYVLGNCQAWLLSAYPPAGNTDPGWWTTYVFSDDFHGSPMTNRLMADLVLQDLRQRGWL
jgi:outer membrane lipase/esterase